MYLFPALILCRETYMYSHREKRALLQNMSVPKIRHIDKSPNNVYNMSTISLYIFVLFLWRSHLPSEFSKQHGIVNQNRNLYFDVNINPCKCYQYLRQKCKI